VEHFEGVLNQPSPSEEFNWNEIVPLEALDIDMSAITIGEIQAAIRSLNSNKAPGIDGINAELLKHGKEVLETDMLKLFNLVWITKKVPDDWKKGTIVTLPKKGDLANCNNWRGITPLRAWKSI